MVKKFFAVLLITFCLVVSVSAQDGGEIRFVQLIYAQADIYIDDELVVPNIAFTVGTDFMPLAAGSHTIAVNRVGEKDAATTTLDVAAGHQYTVITMGEFDSDTPTLEIIDQTTLFAEHDPEGNSAIIVQNLPGAIPVDVWFEDALKIENLEFGGYGTADAPLGQFQARAVMAGQPDMIAFESLYFAVPNTVSLAYLSGIYPDGINRTFFTTTPANLYDYLTAHTSLENSKLTTFFDLLKTAGLDAALMGETPYTLFAPTNDAFAALPEGELDALKADPAALADLLNYHVIEGRYGPYELTGEHTLTSMQGSPLNVSFQPIAIPLNVNGVPTGLQHRTSNGIIYLIESVLTPES